MAVVGASSRPDRVSGRPLGFLGAWGFPGRLAAVNPSHDEIGGVPSYPTVAAIPWTPELAVVCVAAPQVLGVLRECAAAGVGAAIVFAAGFGEVEGGCADEPAIAALAAETGLLVCGPNALGVVNARARLPGTFSGVVAATALSAGDIGFVTQSGALGIYLYADAEQRGLGMSQWVSSGNEAALDFSDYLAWIAEQDDTRVVCGYLEGVRDGLKLRRALARARAAGKPVVLLKGGRSEAGARGARSHTGALAGDAEVYSGIFRQEGAVEVDDTGELLDAAEVLRLRPRLDRAKGVAVATSSGGGAILLADWCARLGLRLADLSSETVARVEAAIPPFGSASNPVDFTGNLMNEMRMVGAVVSALVADPDVTATVLFVGVAGEMGERFIDELLRVERPEDALVSVVWIGIPGCARHRLVAGGIPVFTEASACLTAIARALAWAAETPPPPRVGPGGPGRLEGVVAEREAKALLARLGMPVPRSVEPGEAEPGTAYAVKGEAEGVVHKAAVGLVRLGVPGAEVRAAVRELEAAAADAGVWLTGVLVEEMAPPGPELLVTLRRDATFGWVVVVGAGGTATELIRDVAVRACPLSPEEARAALAELRIAPLLAERTEALVAFLAAVSELPERLPPEVAELELNPVIAGEHGPVVVDAVGFRDTMAPP